MFLSQVDMQATEIKITNKETNEVKIINQEEDEE